MFATNFVVRYFAKAISCIILKLGRLKGLIATQVARIFLRDPSKEDPIGPIGRKILKILINLNP